MRQWAEDHIILNHGDRKVPFRAATQPVSGLFLDLWDSNRYSVGLATGPSQAGKTTHGFNIPTSYDACERKSNQVLGVPQDEMVNDKFSELFSIWRQSPRLAPHVPHAHRRGDGGRIKEKQTTPFGVEIRPMTLGGGDAARAAYTAQYVKVTEAKEFSSQQSTSVEASRLRQIYARMRSFPYEKQRLILEGTSGELWQLPWSERGDDPESPISTMTRLLCPCPHCGDGVSPDREQLAGWQEAKSESEAREKARFVCPSCGGLIDDDQRRAMVRYVTAVHAGQTFEKDYGVVGPHPDTRVLWYGFTAFHNLLVPQEDIAASEWKALRHEEGTEAYDDSQRELSQFIWGRCFSSTLVKQVRLEPRELRKRQDAWDRNVVPPDTQKLTVGIDVGDWTGWWLLLASRANGARTIVAYGAFDVKLEKQDDEKERIKQALRKLLAETIEPGFLKEGTGARVPVDLAFCDGNYLSDQIAEVVRGQKQGLRPRLRFCRGAGASTRREFGKPGSPFTQKKKLTRTIRKIGDGWFEEINHARRICEYTLNVDRLKDDAIKSLAAPAGTPGSISLCRASSTHEHDKITHHFANEWPKSDWEPGKGHVVKWERHGQQHWLDCLAYALGAAQVAGYEPDAEAVAAAQEQHAQSDTTEAPVPESLDWSRFAPRAIDEAGRDWARFARGGAA